MRGTLNRSKISCRLFSVSGYQPGLEGHEEVAFADRFITKQLKVKHGTSVSFIGRGDSHEQQSTVQ